MDIVIPDDYPPTYATLDQVDLQRLAPFGTVRLHTTRAADRGELFERLAEAEVAINVRAYTVFDDELLERASKLKLISILGTGTDNVDLAAAARRGVTVTNTPAVGAPSVAELTLALMLAAVRAVPLSDARVRGGEWQHVEGPELEGKTLGVLGLGAIGGRVARMGRGLGMRVIAWSVTPDPTRASTLGVELVERDEVFRQADVVSVHLRNTPEMRGVVGARELALMRPTAYVVNTARGALVDSDALAAAIRGGKLAGAGLDVFTEEPLPPERNPFLDLPNVVLTPHLGAVTREANARSRAMPVDNIIAFLEGRPRNVVG
ncbi:MAG TPA: hydroxyacid dehydrogenase [Chloroflexota bacterium]|jgi:phosphoglycerate dehydrogenase-like enzyme